MNAKHFAAPWKIMACPVNGGRHEYHDNRWIVTGDAEVELGHVPNDWALSSGSLICQMRDVHPANAALIASSPRLLAALVELERIASQCLSPVWNPQLEEARAAISAAKGV